MQPGGAACILGSSGVVFRGRWHEEISPKGCYLRFNGEGIHYMGKMDSSRSEVSRGVVGKGAKIIGRFSARALTATSTSIPALHDVPRLSPPIPSLPSSVHYTPHFISEADEELLLERVRSAPQWRSVGSDGRRTINFGGSPGERGVAEALPDWLEALIEALACCGAWPEDQRPNHVLINEFSAGAGFVAHTDGPLYAPHVAVLSLGSDVLLDLHLNPACQQPTCAPITARIDDNTLSLANDCTMQQSENSEPCGTDTLRGALHAPHAQMLLRRRSLNVIADGAYTELLHGITAHAVDEVTSLVVNLSDHDLLGEQIERRHRVSIVFVQKLLEADEADVLHSSTVPPAVVDAQL